MLEKSNDIHRVLPAALMIALVIGPLAIAEEKSVSADEQARPAATAEEIAAWISQLDDSRYLTREQATRNLLDAGKASLDPLLVVANGERPEPADRAVWILRRLARSPNSDQAIAALEKTVQLRGRPLLVARAEEELDERSIAACQARLTPLGAEIVMEAAPFDGVTVVPVLHVRLGQKWRGTPADLRSIAQLRRQLYFRLEGKAVNDEVAKLFEERDKLAVVQFMHTTVTPEAIDSLKVRHRDAIIYMRGQALLGVEAKNDPAGAIVSRVAPETAAANAGIMVGDVITSMGGHSLPDFDRLTARIAQYQPGETVELEVIRGAERKKLSVTLGSWPSQE